jgi:hypothetical protein
MDIHFNYDHELVAHYIELLTSPDTSIRSTAIVDIILQGVYKEHPFEFINIMDEAQRSLNYFTTGDKTYDALCRALEQYRSISGLMLREDLDKLEAIIFPTGHHGMNQVENLTNDVIMLKYKKDSMEETVKQLHTKIEHLEERMGTAEMLVRSLQFRIDNGMYETK